MKIINKLKIISIFIFIYPMFGEDNVELEEVVVKGKVLISRSSKCFKNASSDTQCTSNCFHHYR